MGATITFDDVNGSNDFNDPVIIYNQATTDSGGAFSVDVSNVDMTRVHTVHAQCLDTASGVANTTIVSITGVSTTTITGNVYQFSTGLGLTLAAVGSGRTVYLTVTGDLS